MRTRGSSEGSRRLAIAIERVRCPNPVPFEVTNRIAVSHRRSYASIRGRAAWFPSRSSAASVASYFRCTRRRSIRPSPSRQRARCAAAGCIWSSKNSRIAGVVLDPEEVEQAARRPPRGLPRRGRRGPPRRARTAGSAYAAPSSVAAHSRLDRAQAIRPPVDPLEDAVGPPGLGGHRGGGVAPVAHGVYEARLGKQPAQGLRLPDVVRAHLDQPRLALLRRQRPEQVHEEPPAGRHRVGW